MATKVEPVDEVEDEEEDGHGDEEEAVHVDVVLSADVPRRLPPETALHGAASPEKWGKSIESIYHPSMIPKRIQQVRMQ